MTREQREPNRYTQTGYNNDIIIIIHVNYYYNYYYHNDTNDGDDHENGNKEVDFCKLEHDFSCCC